MVFNFVLGAIHYILYFIFACWKQKRKWKTEENCRQLFEELFKKKFPSIFHPDIVNPNTGRKLQLDGYNKELKIAFEYQGMQHYKFPNRWHRTEKDFKDQQWRDEFKRNACKNIGITLIEIPYTERNNLKSYIEEQLKIKKLI